MTPTDGHGHASRAIIISDREHGLPYSKGLMAGAIMTAGLSPARAYHVAQTIEDRLLETGRDAVSTGELRRLATDVLRDEAGERYAEAYMKWQAVADLDRPLIILIGGGTGVGKSTIATQLGARLGIVRIISTDAIREVMKGVVSRRFMPALYTSSFNADEMVRAKIPAGEDPVLAGFREQAAAVAVGVRALVERALTEGTDVIIEGAHIVPGFVTTDDLRSRAVVVQLAVTVDDEDLHRSHFSVRSHQARSRPQHRYLDHFDSIRRIQKFIRSQALAHSVPIVSNYNLDATIASVIELVTTTATKAASAGRRPSGRKPVDPAVAPRHVPDATERLRAVARSSEEDAS
ncbi:MAG TPA: ATP cone domain-containing protein [Actinomycetota bacterium]